MSENLEPLPEGVPYPTPKTEEKPIDPALIEKLGTCRMIVKIDTLLQNGIFIGGAAADLVVSVEFLKKLHEPIMKECQTHPDFNRATGTKEQGPAPILDKALKATALASRAQRRAKAKAN